jgi:hypothetical protein
MRSIRRLASYLLTRELNRVGEELGLRADHRFVYLVHVSSAHDDHVRVLAAREEAAID